LKNAERRQRLVVLRRKLAACNTDTACVERYTQRVRALSSKVNAVERIYAKLTKRLSACPAGLNGKACREKVMSAFRRRIYAKELVLLKGLRHSARRRFTREARICERNMLGNPGGLANCLTSARTTFTERMSQLRKRGLRINRRNALRHCDATADPAGCVKLVNAEFEKDARIAAEDEIAAAKALLAEVTATTVVYATPKP
jgi:hypothetical protein